MKRIFELTSDVSRLAVGVSILLVSGHVWAQEAPFQPTDAAANTSPASAPGRVTGRVIDKSSKDPVVGATVVLLDTPYSTVTGSDGSFSIEGVPPGPYTLSISTYSGLATEVTLAVSSGKAVTASVEIESILLDAETIVVTGTRDPEKRIDVPENVESRNAQDIERSGGASYLSVLADVKGIDFSSSGLGDQRISARGFVTQFNSRMLSMVDGRVATLPGAGLPQGNLLPTSTLDMKAVEVVIGPASAMYGPNAHTGVINVLTKSPWDQPGASLAFRTGMQDLIDGSVRLAGTLKDNFGWKLNAQYLQAQDFVPDPDSDTHRYGTQFTESEIIDLLGGYDIKSFKSDGTVYYRFLDGKWVAKASAGFSENDGFALTNAGRNRLIGWQVQYQNVQVSGPKWYAQFTRTVTAAGRTFQLERLVRTAGAIAAMGVSLTSDVVEEQADALQLIDDSQLFDSELQYRETIAGVKLAAGVQGRVYRPDSGGTYLADAIEDIDANEIGGYVQADYKMQGGNALLKDRLRVLGALRVDNHSNYSTQVSPKASLVYAVRPEHRVRTSYNRAFKSPTILENYLLIPSPFGNLLGNRDGYTIRDMNDAVVAEIDGLEPESVHAVEVGYKGVLGKRIFVDAVAYYSWYSNFISPLTLVANPANPDNPTRAFESDGTIVAQGSPLEGSLLTYINFGKAQVRGADVGVSVYPRSDVVLSASASVIDLVDFTNDSNLQSDLLLNVPGFKLKGSITLSNMGGDNNFVRLGARYKSAHRFESGYWTADNFPGDFASGKIPERVVLDAAFGYTFPTQGFSLNLYALNLLDNDDVDVIGAPIPGRLLYLQVAYSYDGLQF